MLCQSERGVAWMKIVKEKIIERAKNAKRESRYIEFKDRFDVNSSQHWCEIIKDIVAISNSGGGCIVFGVNDDGSPSEYDVSSVLGLDPATITDKIAKYTDIQFLDFEIEEIEKRGHKVAILIINATEVPIIFTKPGTYSICDGKQKTAFGRGTIYFRHGTKSEPGNYCDLQRAVERRIENVKKSWLSGIKKVVAAPLDHIIHVLPPDVKISSNPTASPIRLTDSKDAPACRLETPDKTHPYRQKEVIEKVNALLRNKQINKYDILCVRRVHRVDESRPDFYYKPKYGVPQFSEGFVNWLVESFQKNSRFFDKARKKYRSKKL